MSIRITILCENTVTPSLPVMGEHGFAVFIETKNGNFLFDTGQGLTITHNAKHLKKDLTSIKSIFLSHGHYDHTGGLPELLTLKKEVVIYAHPDIFAKKYALVRNNGQENKKHVGMKYAREDLERQGAQFILNRVFTEVERGIYLTGEVPRITDYEKGDTRLLAERSGLLLPDLLLDDQSLVVKTTQGLVIILGCAHAGLTNILRHIKNYFTKDTIHTIMGGTHLGFLTDTQLENTISDLKRFKFEKLGASHCTGLKAAARLSQEFGDRFFFACVGVNI